MEAWSNLEDALAARKHGYDECVALRADYHRYKQQAIAALQTCILRPQSQRVWVLSPIPHFQESTTGRFQHLLFELRYYRRVKYAAEARQEQRTFHYSRCLQRWWEEHKRMYKAQVRIPRHVYRAEARYNPDLMRFLDFRGEAVANGY